MKRGMKEGKRDQEEEGLREESIGRGEEREKRPS